MWWYKWQIFSTLTVGGTTYNIKDSSGTYLPLNTAGGIASCTGNGENWYYRIATIKITGGYVNRPIVFEISGRGTWFTTIQILFTSTSETDPSLNSFISDNEDVYWMKKTTTSTWELYGKYNEVWGSACLHRITGSGANIGVTVNMVNIGTEMGEGWTRVSAGGRVATATKLATSRTISLTGSVTGSGSFDGSGNLSIATTTNHTHSYLPLSGGTLTGNLTLGYTNNSTQPTIGIKVNDIRSVNSTPAVGDTSVNWYFHMADTPDTAKWWSIMKIKGWTGAYSAWELAGPAHNLDQRTTPLYVRTSNKDSAWGSWRKIYDTSNPPTASEVGAAATGHTHSYLPLSGGTLTGGLNGTKIDTTGSITAGTTSGTVEIGVKAASAAGTIYLYSQGSSTGNRGLYGTNASGSGKGILTVKSDNSVTLNGNAEGLTGGLSCVVSSSQPTNSNACLWIQP